MFFVIPSLSLLKHPKAIEFLKSTEAVDCVEKMVQAARANGVNGVPFIIIDGKWAVNGVQSVECYVQVCMFFCHVPLTNVSVDFPQVGIIHLFQPLWFDQDVQQLQGSNICPRTFRAITIFSAARQYLLVLFFSALHRNVQHVLCYQIHFPAGFFYGRVCIMLWTCRSFTITDLNLFPRSTMCQLTLELSRCI